MVWTVPRTSLCPLQYLVSPLGLSSRLQIEQPHGNRTKQDWVSLWESLHRAQRALEGSAWSGITPVSGLDFTEESACLQKGGETDVTEGMGSIPGPTSLSQPLHVYYTQKGTSRDTRKRHRNVCQIPRTKSLLMKQTRGNMHTVPTTLEQAGTTNQMSHFRA